MERDLIRIIKLVVVFGSTDFLTKLTKVHLSAVGHSVECRGRVVVKQIWRLDTASYLEQMEVVAIVVATTSWREVETERERKRARRLGMGGESRWDGCEIIANIRA